MLNNLCKQRNDLLRIEKDQKAKNRKARIFLGNIKCNILCWLSSIWTENNAHCDIYTDGVWLR
ncbi:hypothetical protein HPB48_016823 [Haemaphysalis longicornis]|uniref:Uncharacterized protein n=1 Tax=Haemaphysalis longicornis TaxID=44386 RepID=A0A9J6GKF1_HAELO|nr:hypothetical protein HPB48_016823 [Haemaphysalis longicornis]